MSKNVNMLYFSPTGNTRKIARKVATSLSKTIKQIDLSRQNVKGQPFSADDIVIVAMPVFHGRVPKMAADALRRFQGGGAYAVSIVVYGNRAYEDALVELNDILTEQDFRVIAAGAFIAQHSILGEIGAGRPDANDLAVAEQFAAAVMQKIESGEDTLKATIPGNRPYKEARGINAIPVVSYELCTQCGTCAQECPTDAISKTNPLEQDASLCIFCMRCVDICVMQARAVPEEILGKATAYLNKTASERRENEIYL